MVWSDKIDGRKNPEPDRRDPMPPTKVIYIPHVFASLNASNTSLANLYIKGCILVMNKCGHMGGWDKPAQIIKWIADCRTEAVMTKLIMLHHCGLGYKEVGIFVATDDEDKIVYSAIEVGNCYTFQRIASLEEGKGYGSFCLKEATRIMKRWCPTMPLSAPVDNNVIPFFKKHGWSLMDECGLSKMVSKRHPIGKEQPMFITGDEAVFHKYGGKVVPKSDIKMFSDKCGDLAFATTKHLKTQNFTGKMGEFIIKA